MKICVTTSRGTEGHEIVDRYPCLERFNPIVTPYKDAYGDDKNKLYIEICFLADILDIMDGTKVSVVIHKKDDWMEECFGKYDCDYIIEIYDDWRE